MTFVSRTSVDFDDVKQTNIFLAIDAAASIVPLFPTSHSKRAADPSMLAKASVQGRFPRDEALKHCYGW